MDLTYPAIALTVVVTLLGAAGLWKLWKRADNAEPKLLGSLGVLAFRQAEKELDELKQAAADAQAAYEKGKNDLERSKAKVSGPV